VGANAPKKFWGQKTYKSRLVIQFGAYNSGTEANFYPLKTAVKPEENGLQDVRSTLTLTSDVNTVIAYKWEV